MIITSLIILAADRGRKRGWGPGVERSGMI